ncbi:hypothetical protein TSOC_001737 [Tetrabaena socialis]|uniref:Protein kinase domain-containing protein n=1 Tax=Tetrabaena socialis TaxID=47790 RepID=A0A2J8AFT8_9CHLO|nr:hypothetical protein TSOC_001737 [Tetrabaena socialis]|eukprot:PNH11379.1 hypothetical protein TSOC_001737 [Tetrabaena socialis]
MPGCFGCFGACPVEAAGDSDAVQPSIAARAPATDRKYLAAQLLDDTLRSLLLSAATNTCQGRLSALASDLRSGLVSQQPAPHPSASLFVYSDDSAAAVVMHSAGPAAERLPPGLVEWVRCGCSHAALLRTMGPLVHSAAAPLEPLPADWQHLTYTDDADAEAEPLLVLLPLRRGDYLYGSLLLCWGGAHDDGGRTPPADASGSSPPYGTDELEELSRYLSVGLLGSAVEVAVLQLLADGASAVQRAATVQEAMACLIECVQACLRLSSRLELDCLPAIAFGSSTAAFFRSISPPPHQHQQQQQQAEQVAGRPQPSVHNGPAPGLASRSQSRSVAVRWLDHDHPRTHSLVSMPSVPNAGVRPQQLAEPALGGGSAGQQQPQQQHPWRSVFGRVLQQAQEQAATAPPRAGNGMPCSSDALGTGGQQPPATPPPPRRGAAPAATARRPAAAPAAPAPGRASQGDSVTVGSRLRLAATAGPTAAASGSHQSVVVPNCAAFLMADERQPYKDVLFVQRLLPRARAHGLVLVLPPAAAAGVPLWTAAPSQRCGHRSGLLFGLPPRRSYDLNGHPANCYQQPNHQANGNDNGQPGPAHSGRRHYGPRTLRPGMVLFMDEDEGLCGSSAAVASALEASPAAALCDTPLPASRQSSLPEQLQRQLQPPQPQQHPQRQQAPQPHPQQHPQGGPRMDVVSLPGTGPSGDGAGGGGQSNSALLPVACPAASLALYLVASESVPRVILEGVAEDAKGLLEDDVYAVRLLKIIGRGGQGMVFKGLMYNTVVAVKIIPSAEEPGDSAPAALTAPPAPPAYSPDLQQRPQQAALQQLHQAQQATAQQAAAAADAAAALKLQQRHKRWLVLNFFTDALVVEYSNEYGRYRLMPREDNLSAKGCSNTAIIMGGGAGQTSSRDGDGGLGRDPAGSSSGSAASAMPNPKQQPHAALGRERSVRSPSPPAVATEAAAAVAAEALHLPLPPYALPQQQQRPPPPPPQQQQQQLYQDHPVAMAALALRALRAAAAAEPGSGGGSLEAHRSAPQAQPQPLRSAVGGLTKAGTLRGIGDGPGPHRLGGGVSSGAASAPGGARGGGRPYSAATAAAAASGQARSHFGVPPTYTAAAAAAASPPAAGTAASAAATGSAAPPAAQPSGRWSRLQQVASGAGLGAGQRSASLDAGLNRAKLPGGAPAGLAPELMARQLRQARAEAAAGVQDLGAVADRGAAAAAMSAAALAPTLGACLTARSR